MAVFHRLRFLAPAAVGVGFSAVACTSPIGAGAPVAFQAANYVPSSSALFFTMTMRPSLGQVAQVKGLQDTFSREPGFDAALAEWQSQTPGNGPDLQRDVLPLLDGEVADAEIVRPPDQQGSSSTVDLVLAHASDPVHLMALILQAGGQTLVAAVPGAPSPSPQQPSASPAPPTAPGPHGAVIYQSPYGQTLGATFSGWVLLSDSTPVLNDTIEAINRGGAGGLGVDTRFTSLLNRLPDDKLGYVYVNDAAMAENGGGFGSGTGLGLGQTAVSLAASSAGLDMQWESTDALPLVQPQGTGDAMDALAHLPSTTVAAVGGSNARDILTTLQGQAGVISSYVAQVGGGRGTAGSGATSPVPSTNPMALLHLDQWVDGSFAFGVIPGTGVQIADLFQQMLVVQVTDTDLASQDLTQIDLAAPPKALSVLQVDGGELHEIATGRTPTSYGLLGDWLYVIQGDPTAVVVSGDGGLNANPRYGQVTPLLVHDGVDVFVDLQGLRGALEPTLAPTDLPDYYAKVKPLVEPMRAFGGSLTSDGQGLHGRFRLAINS